MSPYLSWSEALSQWWRSAVCRALGHAKPQQRMFCRTCSRCNEVVR